MPAGVGAANGNSGPAPTSSGRHANETSTAVTTGTKLRGFHSNSSSSTASMIAAKGVPKMPVIPAVAPATSNVLRSAALNLNNCANKDPIAPPVMMIGPSAPKGPPLPIDTADEIGFRIATLSDSLLSPNRMVSIASGMPWPRILSEPYRAMRPTIRPPSTGIRTTSSAGRLAIAAAAKDRWPYQKRLVASAISLSSAQALNAPPVPQTVAIAARISMR